MDEKRVAEHYKLAEIAAKAAAYQLHQRAVRGHAKSPTNAAEVVAVAWAVALQKAREHDPVEVTPEMIQAGEYAMEDYPDECGFPVYEQVKQVYIAMERARIRQAEDLSSHSAHQAGRTTSELAGADRQSPP